MARGLLTQEQKDKCLASKGWDCPYCGSSELIWFKDEYINCRLTRHVSCSDCGLHWRLAFEPVKVTSLPRLNAPVFVKRYLQEQKRKLWETRRVEAILEGRP